MRGCAAGHAGQSCSSSRRSLSAMRRSWIGTSRSARSPRSPPRSMPLKMMQRRNEKTARSESVYSRRRTSPSPVTARQIESDSHGGMSERLSSPTTHDPAAAVTHESGSRGGLRAGTGVASTVDTTSFMALVLPVPCSPKSPSTGWGVSGRRAAISQAASNGRSSGSTLSHRHSSPSSPPRRGPAAAR